MWPPHEVRDAWLRFGDQFICIDQPDVVYALPPIRMRAHVPSWLAFWRGGSPRLLVTAQEADSRWLQLWDLRSGELVYDMTASYRIFAVYTHLDLFLLRFGCVGTHTLTYTTATRSEVVEK